MKLNLPGGEQALDQVFQRYPAVVLAQAALVTASIALNLFVIILAFSGRALLTRVRLSAAPWNFARGLQVMGQYLFIFFGVMIFALMMRQEFAAALARSGLGILHMTAMSLAVSQLLSLVLVANFASTVKRDSGVSLGSYW